jgi:hypothetical protein
MHTDDKLVNQGLDDIKRQVPGIVTKKEQDEKPTCLKDEELFFRTMNKGS